MAGEGEGKDTLKSGDGDDGLGDGAGDDEMLGGGGNDTVSISDVGDIAIGGTGFDVLVGDESIPAMRPAGFELKLP